MHTFNAQLNGFRCEICDFITNRRDYLTTHLEDKSPRKYKYNECFYQARRKYHLKEHCISKHTPNHLIHWHKCNICVFKTKQRSNFGKHVKSWHVSDNQMIWFKCQICDARWKFEATCNI